MSFLSRFEQCLDGCTVEKLSEENFKDYIGIFESNEKYWQETQGRPANEQDCIDTINFCPVDFDKSKVCCLGIRKAGNPVAALSLLEDYPEQGTAYIGLLLVDGSVQRSGIGTGIVTAIIKASYDRFDSIRLSVAPNNTSALRFWQEQGFTVDEIEYYKETDNLPMRFELGA